MIALSNANHLYARPDMKKQSGAKSKEIQKKTIVTTRMV